MQQRFAEEGISVRLNAAANRVSFRGRKIVLEFREGDPISANAMLIAAGRTPICARSISKQRGSRSMSAG